VKKAVVKSSFEKKKKMMLFEELMFLACALLHYMQSWRTMWNSYMEQGAPVGHPPQGPGRLGTRTAPLHEHRPDDIH